MMCIYTNLVCLLAAQMVGATMLVGFPVNSQVREYRAATTDEPQRFDPEPISAFSPSLTGMLMPFRSLCVSAGLLKLADLLDCCCRRAVEGGIMFISATRPYTPSPAIPNYYNIEPTAQHSLLW